eukprot:GILI01006318.1.p1 GENE.GILI01006318.1~~GILI01006318.1.p1  ORF type:complete len:647 (+),score=157.75 GILI01006318.1:2-1942(+)
MQFLYFIEHLLENKQMEFCCYGFREAGNCVRGLCACLCCLVCGGPILLIVGIVLLVAKNDRQDHIDEYNNAVDAYDPTPVNAWAVGATINGQAAAASSRTDPVEGNREDINRVGDSRVVSATVSSQSDYTYALTSVTPFTVSNVQTSRSLTVDAKCNRNLGCSFSQMSTYCSNEYGGSYTGPNSCSDDTTCGTCSYSGVLSEVCAVVSSTVPYVRDTRYSSCFYPFGNSDQIYTRSTSQVLAYARKADDPFLVLQRVTEGTNDFGITEGEQRTAGIVCLVIGIVLIVCICGVGYAAYHFIRQHQQKNQQTQHQNHHQMQQVQPGPQLNYPQHHQQQQQQQYGQQRQNQNQPQQSNFTQQHAQVSQGGGYYGGNANPTVAFNHQQNFQQQQQQRYGEVQQPYFQQQQQHQSPIPQQDGYNVYPQPNNSRINNNIQPVQPQRITSPVPAATFNTVASPNNQQQQQYSAQTSSVPRSSMHHQQQQHHQNSFGGGASGGGLDANNNNNNFNQQQQQQQQGGYSYTQPNQPPKQITSPPLGPTAASSTGARNPYALPAQQQQQQQGQSNGHLRHPSGGGGGQNLPISSNASSSGQPRTGSLGPQQAPSNFGSPNQKYTSSPYQGSSSAPPPPPPGAEGNTPGTIRHNPYSR